MRRLATLAITAALLVPGAAAAQDGDTRQVCVTVTGAPADVTAGALLAGLLNGSITLDAVSAQCEAPTTPPVVGPGDYGADLPGVGVTQSHGGVDVTIVEVDWQVDGGRRGPEPGKRLVAILVLYVATEEGGSYNPYNWSAVDLDGFEWRRAVSSMSKDPTLSSSNDLPKGRRAQGWITFEVPEDVQALEIVETQGFSDHLRWLISR